MRNVSGSTSCRARGLVGLVCLNGAGLVGLSLAISLSQFTPADRLSVRILSEYPHDITAFTQGLLRCNDTIIESTGRYGRSLLRRYNLSDGQLLGEVKLSPSYFGEGLARIGNRFFQLTWLSGVALVYDAQTLKEVRRLTYQGQGWGLAYDGKRLIMSDGSDLLFYRDPESFRVQETLSVTLEGQPVFRLNELEFAEGAVYANIWQSTDIVRIDPASGRVTAVIDASSLPYQPRNLGEDVLNGIAYDHQNKTFLLTGKLWPRLYEVRFE